MTLTLSARLERTAAEHPHSAALILGEDAELDDEVRAALAALLKA